jgi:hypothetical protein
MEMCENYCVIGFRIILGFSSEPLMRSIEISADRELMKLRLCFTDIQLSLVRISRWLADWLKLGTENN